MADPHGAYPRHASDQMAPSNSHGNQDLQYYDAAHGATDPHRAYRRHNSDQMASYYRNEGVYHPDASSGSNRRATYGGQDSASLGSKYAPRSHQHRMSNMRSSDTSNSTHNSTQSSVAGSFSRQAQQKSNVQYNTMNSPAIMNIQRFGNENNVRASTYQDEYFDDDASRCTRTQAFHPSATNKAKDMTPPQGDVTIIFTDVQGSTSLWEACPTDMKKAQDIHDMILRQCYANHSGYEITTEGDAFILAFHHPVDALAFALEAQLKLYKAGWPQGILNHDDGKDEPSLKFRGFRVRFGVHHGPTSSKVHEMTRRTVYSGEAVKIAKAVEGMCHGGQILCTMETWMAVSGMAERYLGRPQILDCGEHLLFERFDGVTTTKYTRRIIQLVPSELAFDFFEARGRKEVPSQDGSGKMRMEVKNALRVQGRLFPPIISKKQLTTGFLNAPYANGRVTICFVYTNGIDQTNVKESIAKHIRKQLLEVKPPGYECQEDNGCWMLAFDRMANAVFFGLQLVSDMEDKYYLGDIFKIGIVTGAFTSMGPHKTTGMADYFGPIVNRAARVASNCQLGEVCVGIPLDDGVAADPPDFGSTVTVRLEGIKKLKGISIDTAIFSCRHSSSTESGYAY
jgi:class 3 adenylate cyclase